MVVHSILFSSLLKPVKPILEARKIRGGLHGMSMDVMVCDESDDEGPLLLSSSWRRRQRMTSMHDVGGCDGDGHDVLE